MHAGEYAENFGLPAVFPKVVEHIGAVCETRGLFSKRYEEDRDDIYCRIWPG
jgi:hypothetical protein